MAGNSNNLSREPAQDLAAKATSPGLAGATCAEAINTRAQVREIAGELARKLYEQRLTDVPWQEMRGRYAEWYACSKPVISCLITRLRGVKQRGLRSADPIREAASPPPRPDSNMSVGPASLPENIQVAISNKCSEEIVFGTRKRYLDPASSTTKLRARPVDTVVLAANHRARRPPWR